MLEWDKTFLEVKLYMDWFHSVEPVNHSNNSRCFLIFKFFFFFFFLLFIKFYNGLCSKHGVIDRMGLSYICVRVCVCVCVFLG